LPRAVPFPVAVGAVAAAHGVPAAQALAAYLHAAVSQSVSTGIRLGVSGQVEGVAILAEIEGLVADIADKASLAALDDLGGAAVQAEIASLRHETQHSRLFRS
ncbi:urease accessory protein UreF, partial [Neorhizobium sp. BETTINA12A]|uniref:urease accessory protein UreF n=1 Tax=Neorhizobium sp. BETTINA12A TaxID=2908924 RepID=UPI0028682BFB